MDGTLLDIARLYVAAGISVLPIALDGQKRPATGVLPLFFDPAVGRYHRGWSPLRRRLPMRAELAWWWGGPRPFGMAAVCGGPAGLEALDFDAHAEEVFPAWRDLVESLRPGLLARLPVVRTPREPAGYHVWLRCTEVPTPGSVDLATDHGDGKRTVLIQTRGEGGYCLLPGSPAACHPSGRPYEQISGPPVYEVTPVSASDRGVLVEAAGAFGRPKRRPAVQPFNPPARHGSDLLPGEDFDRRGDLVTLLTQHGWAIAYERGEVIYLRRPGKARGGSATYGRCRGRDGVALLKVFTSSSVFEMGGCYGPFRAYALLEHGGDLRTAARTLYGQGYGGPGGEKRAAAA